MTKEEELAYWSQLIGECCENFTLEYLAGEWDVSVRSISSWKAGDGRPTGFKAIKVYLFHAKHGRTPPVDGGSLHVQITGRTVTS
jgi:hypothetical protein